MRPAVHLLAILATITGGVRADDAASLTEYAPFAAPPQQVSACMKLNSVPPDGIGKVRQAQELASRMYGKIGITLTWYTHNCTAGETDVVVSFARDTGLKEPGILAYALPFEGTHIVVFYGRVAKQVPRALLSTYTAHVLAHEIGHVLEGMARHSNEGVMKAQFNTMDRFRMATKPLDFAAGDVELIHLGIAARQRYRIAGGLLAAR